MPEFYLSPTGTDGVSCGADGAFIGATPLLDRVRKNDRDEWHPRDCKELSEQIGARYGLPIDMSSKRGGLKAIANALNEGNVARAQIATVLLGIPDPLPLSKRTRSRDETIALIRDLHWSGMLKWDSDEHPRWPAGTPDDKGGKKGGKFAPKGGGGGTGTSPASRAADHTNSRRVKPDTAGARTRLANDSPSGDADDPIAEAATRVTTAHSPANPAVNEHENIWEAFGTHFSHEVKSALARIGQAEIAGSNANLAIAVDESNAIAHALKAYADYRARPWLNSRGRPIEFPAVDFAIPVVGEIELMDRLAAHQPLMRPATNADWIDPLINLASLGAMGAGVPFKFAGPVTEAIDVADIATTSTNVAERTFATTEGVAVRGSRAIDRAASYETGVQKLYGDVPLSQRKFQATVDGREVSGVADSTTVMNDQHTAIDAKYVDLWSASLRNPESEIGAEPWAIAEQQNMMQQAKAYSSSFRGGVVYHTNSVELANYYTNLFEKAGIQNFRFKITPASKMGKRMTKDWKEELFGKPPYKRNIPGATPNTENNVRYISFDDPASIGDVFDSVLDQIRPRLYRSGGVVLDGTKLELPDGRRFVAVHYHMDVDGWRKQIEQGASKLGRATAKIAGGNVIVSDGQSYPLSSCKVELS
jgi:hypothetical protein